METKPNVVNEKLIKAFAAASAKAKDAFYLVGDNILVGRLPKQEMKTSSGLIIASGKDKQINAMDSSLPEFVQVLAVGKGFYNEEEKKEVPLELSPGNIIEVARFSVSWFSAFGLVADSEQAGTGVGITREREYRVKFDTYEAYLEFMAPFYEIDTKGGSNV